MKTKEEYLFHAKPNKNKRFKKYVKTLINQLIDLDGHVTHKLNGEIHSLKLDGHKIAEKELEKSLNKLPILKANNVLFNLTNNENYFHIVEILNLELMMKKFIVLEKEDHKVQTNDNPKNKYFDIEF